MTDNPSLIHSDTKKDLMRVFLSILNKRIDQDQLKKIRKSTTNLSSKEIMKEFAKSLCFSCYGDINNLFYSINCLDSTNNLTDLNELQIRTAQYMEVVGKYGDAYIRCELKRRELKDDFEYLKFFIQHIEEELSQISLSSPELKKRTEDMLKLRVKSEKTNQLIIDDLIFLIDKLNRSLKLR